VEEHGFGNPAASVFVVKKYQKSIFLEKMSQKRQILAKIGFG